MSGPATTPRIAVAPAGVRDHLRDAVAEGGGTVVEVDRAEGLVWTATEDADGLRAALAAGTSIRWVQLLWAGIEPYRSLLEDERVWTSGKGVYAPPVAEHALALALAGLRDLKRRATAHRWDPQGGVSLLGGKVTIFGGGGITCELLRLLEPFGADITVVRKRPRPMPGVRRVLSFGERYDAIADVDVIFLALALTAETERLFTAVEFEQMAPHAWIVNVARGAHIDTADLVIALQGDVIGGAALDVTDPEPLPDAHPLWGFHNCLITPHTANTEGMAVPLIAARVRENVARFAAGEELLGAVDARLGY